MIRFTASILKFDQQGEKTGWTYIPVPAHLAQELIPGIKKSFRVKGLLDEYPFKLASLTPMGKGDYILSLNATMRKGIGKRAGATVSVQMEVDKQEIELPEDFKAWLKEDEAASTYFYSLPKSHQHYWINWVNAVKSEQTRQSRLTRAIVALSKGLDFGGMLRAEKAQRAGF